MTFNLKVQFCMFKIIMDAETSPSKEEKLVGVEYLYNMN